MQLALSQMYDESLLK